MNVSYKATGQNYVSFAHWTNASGIQFAYDENENIPSRLGTTCVSGMLTCLENVSCSGKIIFPSNSSLGTNYTGSRIILLPV